MNEPLGEYGGVVTRNVTLFQTDYKIGDELPSDLLGEIPLRHRMALKGSGLVSYHSEPRSAEAGYETSAPSVDSTDDEPTPTKTKTRKKRSKSTKRRK